ncbi:MAG: aminomethyl-transferring glycine dehydrogenase subunit GcvPA [Deltaproteobacteria bacterium]|nr:aminomethyl-transferring glycine dehydrogenase subunit GcvPA [Deltaproteobacteria bacterium]
MRYLPHTPEEIQSMLETVGKASLDDLFDVIPEAARQPEPLKLEPALYEGELMRHLEQLAGRNRAGTMLSFLGAGAYDHGFPQAADQLLMRSELYTAYTPYQPEVAQGTLQIVFEFQTIVSEILGLPVANASMYDASTGLAEAVLMARRLTKRDRAVVSGCVHPQYVDTVETYVRELDQGVSTITRVPAAADGSCDLAALSAAIDDQTACVVVGYPSFYGPLTDLTDLAKTAHDHGAMLVTATGEPYVLALVEPPGALGADIAVAEGQPLSLPPQYGGPGVGLFACTGDKKVLQQMPGRLCGETTDKNGKRGYVLTLATREQHIRRERATSNICTNSGLGAAAVTIKMSLLGKQGFIETAEQCLAKAEYLKEQIAALDGYALPGGNTRTFNEFLVTVPGGDASQVVGTLTDQDIIPGYALGEVDPSRKDQLLVAVTEIHTREQLDRLVTALGDFRPAAA